MSHTHGHTHDHGHGHSHDHATHDHAHHDRSGETQVRAPRPAEPGFSLFRLSAAIRMGGALAATCVVWLGVLWALD